MDTMLRRWTTLLFIPFALISCEAYSPTSPAVSETPLELLGDPIRGSIAFENNCSSCHASRDGFDLALFSFMDTTIIRRALKHVDESTSLDILAHIRHLKVHETKREESSPFQPGGRRLDTDYEFAINIFGADEWPAWLTSEGLRLLDMRKTEVAVNFPVWSIEENNLDWMPDEPISDFLFNYKNGRARKALDKFYRERSVLTLIDAVDAFSDGDRDPNNPDAPCIMNPMEQLRPKECFNARRWAASLGGQYMLRHGLDAPVHREIHRVWWDVGNVARKSVRNDIDNRIDNWVSWMWMGWAFEPAAHSSVYLSQGLELKGMLRHATLHILKSQVERGRNSTRPYGDLKNVSRFAPDAWLMNAMEFGYRHLLERLEDGEHPTSASGVTSAITLTERAYSDAVKRLTADQATVLVALRDQVLDHLR
jgi:hypothetical protein